MTDLLWGIAGGSTITIAVITWPLYNWASTRGYKHGIADGWLGAAKHVHEAVNVRGRSLEVALTAVVEGVADWRERHGIE